MEPKAIFLDIDGTLTPPGSNTPPESALEVIRAAQAKGHKVFLCTGRNPAMLAPLLVYGFDGVVACAGGYVVWGEQVLYDHPMTRQQLDTALTALHGQGVFCTIEAKDATYGDEEMPDFLVNGTGGNSEIARWRKALAARLGIQPMGLYDGRPIYKVVFMCQEDSQLAPARALLEQDFQFCCQTIVERGCCNGELINRAFDKGRGVRRVCEAMGIPLSQTVGFGDSMNDLEMLQTVGASVCMENGDPRLQAISAVVCPPVEADGLAQAFRTLGLA